ncbi:hypothetical protein ACQPZU_01055 [Saccharomonospora azurea]|uniref:hypothetical protein n=1 Tax=Saccharomonospora azurea TaxID=40988 RepID=UPI003D931453
MLVALGDMIRAASMADLILRKLYRALVGSHLAEVTANGQMTRWLIDECGAILDHRTDLAEPIRTELRAMLTDAKNLSEKRNRYVHDVWSGTGTPGGHVLVRSKRRTIQWDLQEVSLDGLIEVGTGFRKLTVDVMGWQIDNLGAV